MLETKPRQLISSTLRLIIIRSSFSISSATKSLIRFSSTRYASRNARRRSASVPCTAAGSGTPQWAVTGFPGHTAQTSPAAWSQTVNTKSITGAPSLANSSQLLLRSRLVSRCAFSSRSSANGCHDAPWKAAGAVAFEPAFAPMLDQSLGENAPRRVAGTEKQYVVNAPPRHIGLSDASSGFVSFDHGRGDVIFDTAAGRPALDHLAAFEVGLDAHFDKPGFAQPSFNTLG